MNITAEQLKEFKEIYKKEFGKDISDVDAIKIADQFLDLLKSVYKSTMKRKYNEF